MTNVHSNQKLHVIHQCGQPRVVKAVQDAYKARQISAEVVPYFDDIAPVYEKADLVIARAGASTVSELITMAIPSILIPLANSIDNHQVANAHYYAKHGACMILREAQLKKGEKLANMVHIFMHNPSQYIRMVKRAHALARWESTQEMVEKCRQYLDKS